MTTTGSWPRSRIGLAVFLYGSVIAAIFSFVLYQHQGMVAATIDLNGFGSIARSIARGDGFSIGYGPTTRRGPLYPYLGAALLKLFGSDAPGLSDAVFFRPILIANCLIFGLTCLAVWHLASSLFGARTALLAAIVCPLVPQSLRYVGMTEVETLMGLGTVLLASTGLALVRRPTIVSGLAFGITAAATTLAKPVVLVYPAVFLLAAAWYWRRSRTLNREAITASVVAIACFGALLLPWTIRNISVTDGKFKGISSNGPGEFLRGYINAQPKYYLLRQNFGGGDPGEKWDPEANAYEEQLLKPHGIAFYRPQRDPVTGETTLTPPPPKGVTSAQLEVEKDRVEGAEVKRRVLGAPFEFAAKFLAQFGMFWYIVETRSKSLLVGGVALVVLILSLVGVLRARREGVLVWPVVFTLVYFNVIYAAILAFARYSMPLFPTLTVLAAGGVAALVAPLSSKLRSAPPTSGRS
ncbi:MAG: glycosyltransferase family 39 protein [Pseudomonadota bacterium]